MNLAALVKTKTFWTGLIAILSALGAFVMGDMNLAQFIQTTVTGLIGIFLRDALTKGGASSAPRSVDPGDDFRGR
ncbi:MAG: hypothetical protein HC933_05575 [Pleurocapsa sp. SU_196_0]|nr:hypothetical protein [Pleurocapsa sp. SU_196_0]